MPRHFRIEALPEELKVRVLELVDEADQNYKDWSETLLYVRHDTKSELKNLINAKKNRYGKGIYWMSLVSKAWRKRTAPWYFKNLYFDGLLEPEYIFDIGPQYSESFTHLTLDNNPLFTDDQIIQCMALLNNRTTRLRSMNVKSGTIASLFRCESLPPNEWIQSFPLPSRFHASRAWEALAGKLEKLQELSIECDFDPLPLQVQDLVLSCPNLTTLNLVVDALWDWHEAEITTAIVTGIQSLKNLRHLSITLHKNVTGTFDLDPLVATLNSSTSRPSLVSLSIAASHIHSSWLPLASLFSETLVSLNFTSFDDDSSEFGTYTTPFLFSGSSFPRLRTLSVSAIRSVTEPLLLSANSTSFPRLNSISFGLNFFDHVDAESMSSANALFAHLRGLAPCAQEISIHDKYWSMPASVDRIAQRWKSKSSAPGGPSMLEAFVDEESGGPRMAPKEYVTSISRTVDYLVGLRNRAIALKTETSWTELESLLREVEMHRVLMQS